MADPYELVQDHVKRYLQGEGKPADIVPHLEQMSPSQLTSLLPTLFATGEIGAHHEALRDTINAVLYRKLSESLVRSICALDRSTQRLTIAGWWITVVVGIVGVVIPILITVRCGR